MAPFDGKGRRVERSGIMQAECFAEYLRCTRENTAGALAPDLACTSILITCVNAHLYGSLGEHLVDRPGEAEVTGKAFLETGLIIKVLERHVEEIQAYASRARSLGSTAPTAEEAQFKGFERDLDRFIQTIIQDLQERHHSD
jgi:hypothetical protein